MGFQPIPTKKFIAWLKSKGLTRIRSKGDHDIWNFLINPLNRPIVIRSKDKEIPPLHINSTLITLGISYKDFQKEINLF